MKYEKCEYVHGGTAIKAYSDWGEPWATVSINLTDYGLKPEDSNHIFIPVYKLDETTVETIKHDLVEAVVREVRIGDFKAPCLYVKLKENWRDIYE